MDVSNIAYVLILFNMNNFEISENNGRNKAVSAMNTINFGQNTTIIPTKNDKEWDFEVRDKNSNRLVAVVEAKDRKFPSTARKVRDGGVQLEEHKYNVLRSIGGKKNIPAYYLATFEDNRFYMWDVTTAPTTEDDRLCNRTTAVNRGKIMKHCFYFDLRDSKCNGYY